ncbi:hypothetical protein [Azospirillum isscasi]|uniref:Uncharacterized protein n=1 Tax=Azospirillum isscasi TaxID=3053926 RepID=A0ABU0WMT6_9PROT|nr:hypothetical protein [Azospirillum isscasi]MDQ2105520.1 hypothetical protein [Azospirillum isscasi]
MPWNRTPSYQAITLLRRHSRECRGLETREYLVAVERRMVQLIDLEGDPEGGREEPEARGKAALPLHHAAE